MSGDGRIKAIDRDSVHRIHSGQVVLDLQGAIKELVENSIDAGATSIDVRIKDNGLESIEVVDNGSGISEEDWPSIGLKHHTSKLPSLEELPDVLTFGFRGEALSSLCALSESVTVTTATKETAPMAAVIVLGRDGRVLDSSGRAARQRGTTVAITGLFKPLPVRRKEFERTAKREFTKALGVLTSYALVPSASNAAASKSGVRLKVENIGGGRGGKRNTVLATDGRGALRSSVSAVWGVKALEGIVDIDLELDVEVDKVMARREGITETSQTVRVSGLISSAAWGQGRSSPDRQYVYINGRPCTMPQVVKAVNETYKSFNTNQYPLAILDFEVPRHSVDINVSPDKRTIFLHSQANLIEALRSSLDKFFEPSRSSYAVGGASHTVKVTQVEVAADTGTDKLLDEEEELGPSRTRSVSMSAAAESDSEDEREEPASRQSARNRQQSSRVSRIPVIQQTLDTTVAAWSTTTRSSSSSTAAASRSGSVAKTKAPTTGRAAQRNLHDRLAWYARQDADMPGTPDEPADAGDKDQDGDEEEEEGEEGEEEEEGEEGEGEEEEDGEEGEDELDISSDNERPMTEVVEMATDSSPMPVGSDLDSDSEEAKADGDLDLRDDAPEGVVADAELPRRRHYTPPASLSTQTVDVESTVFAPLSKRKATDTQERAEAGGSIHIPVDQGDEPQHEEIESAPLPLTDNGPAAQGAGNGYRDEISSFNATGEAVLRFDLDRLRKRYQARARRHASVQSPQRQDAFTAVSRGASTKDAGVSNRDPSAAEAALSRVINKADFERMEVVGQFNKGFIIARLQSQDDSISSDDLFIVDQHASDEKFNFETLQRTTIIKAQSLIRPRPMQLTSADEIVAMENLDVLKANGFEVDVDEEAAPGRGERISLKAMPVSKETTFDFRDLEQLLHLLSDSARPQGQMVRCTKAQAMFAMRACRRSIMIGKSLTKAQMVNVLRNMGTIDQPWNCPHGRPTMRHLCTLSTMSSATLGNGRIDWSKWTPA